jgi:hypothetical protein
MAFQTYLGIISTVLGLVLIIREVSRRQFAEALHSVSLCVIGALLLTQSLLEPGWASRAFVGGAFLLGVTANLAARRISRQRRS